MVIKTDKILTPFPNATEERRSSLRQALPQILAVCVKNVLLLGFGMTLGFPTILIPSLSGNSPNEKFSLGQEAISWIGSINLICVPIGCLLSGAATQPIGRKRAMQFVNIPFLAAWLLFHFSNDVWQVFVALAITGVTGGLLEAPTLTYVAEITQPKLRGTLASTSTVAIISGILIQFLLGTFLNWRTVALVSCIIPVISYILLIFVPESPHWLLSKNRFLDARKSLAFLRGWTSLDEIEPEFKELLKQLGKDNIDDGGIVGIDNPAFNVDDNGKGVVNKKGDKKINKKTTMLWANIKLYGQKNFLWPYTLVSFVFLLGHFSGMTTLQTYAVKIFATFRAPIDKYYATIALGVAEVCGCILSACLVHYLGKRVMNFFSLTGCSACFFIVACYSYITDIKYLENHSTSNNLNETILSNLSSANYDNNSYTWLPTTFLIGAAFFTHSGIRVLPWMLVGEVYSNETRATASGLSGGLSYVFGFISNKIFLTMVSNMTIAGSFWLYSGACAAGIVVLYLSLPETEGKTLFEITEHFAGNGQLDNKVFRNKRPRTPSQHRPNENGEVNNGFNADIESKL